MRLRMEDHKEAYRQQPLSHRLNQEFLAAAQCRVVNQGRVPNPAQLRTLARALAEPPHKEA